MRFDARLLLKVQIFSLIKHISVVTSLPPDSNVLHSSKFNGACGNGRFSSFVDDATNITFRKYVEHPEFSQFRKGLSRIATDRNFVERLRNELTLVRLNVVYDASFEAEFKNNKIGMESYIRNFIFATQLIFEQPELYSQLKINLVVVSIRKSSQNFGSELNAQRLIQLFSMGSDLSPNADLDVLFMFRSLWERFQVRETQVTVKTLGLSYPGTFCNRRGAKTLVVSGSSIGLAITLAHELAHSFNVGHDDENLKETSGTGSSSCDSNSFIMSPTNGPQKMHWSRCSVAAMTNYFIAISDCIFNVDRMRGAIPVNDFFNFRPSATGNIDSNRLPLPGVNLSLDLQCVTAFDSLASSTLTKYRRNGEEAFETCQDHVCVLGETEISIGPAPGGSMCKINRIGNWLGETQFGTCRNGACSYV